MAKSSIPRSQFFVTCPHCKRKFGVAPEVVLNYVDRLFTKVWRNIEKSAKKMEGKVRKRGS